MKANKIIAIILITIIAITYNTGKVKATAYQDWAQSQSRYRYDDHGTNTYSSWETTPHTWEPTLPLNKAQWRVKATNGLSYENTYIIKFAYRPIPQAISPTRIQIYADDGTIDYEEITCTQWAYNNDGFNVVSCSFTPMNDISSSTWLIIEVNFTQGYLTSFRSYMNQYEERTGVNSVITQTGDQITNEIENATNEITNIIIENNQNIINSITENNKTCTLTQINKQTNGLSHGILANDCQIGNSATNWVTKLYKIEEGTKLYAIRTGTSRVCFYNEIGQMISLANPTQTGEQTIPEGTKYVRFNVANANNYTFYELYQCQNNIDALLNNDHQYNKEDIGQQVEGIHELEYDIMGRINTSVNDELNIQWNANANSYIWSIFNRLFVQNAIVWTFITSILGLGIIKIILGR